jgi:hypothetical protein
MAQDKKLADALKKKKEDDIAKGLTTGQMAFSKSAIATENNNAYYDRAMKLGDKALERLERGSVWDRQSRYLKAEGVANKAFQKYEATSANIAEGNLRTARDMAAIMLIESARPSEMGNGELPEDEQKKKDEYNKKVKALKAAKK